MATIKKNQMKELDEKASKAKLSELKMELMKLNSQRALGASLQSPGQVKSAKRNIAKLLTHINTLKNKKEESKKA
jgi:ribosomal protein L29